ncbi:hypothetical protein DPMN_155950 [Dreissena polymorpha]|uniref:Uncharacterized protein n=1 Tax=Dreissena polymorpha TaxID=45954 RepID=A0A9D4FUP0_DREPO|nr:hypothetical protein DPMN_155950 [Dreissena polymorpha]
MKSRKPNNSSLLKCFKLFIPLLTNNTIHDPLHSPLRTTNKLNTTHLPAYSTPSHFSSIPLLLDPNPTTHHPTTHHLLASHDPTNYSQPLLIITTITPHPHYSPPPQLLTTPKLTTPTTHHPNYSPPLLLTTPTTHHLYYSPPKLLTTPTTHHPNYSPPQNSPIPVLTTPTTHQPNNSSPQLLTTPKLATPKHTTTPSNHHPKTHHHPCYSPISLLTTTPTTHHHPHYSPLHY